MIYSVTVNTLIINVLVIPILWWEIRRSRSAYADRGARAADATPAREA